MADNLFSIPETLIIPKGSHERFLGSDDPVAREWYDNGVLLAGISNLLPGYQVIRDNTPWIALLYCIDGQFGIHGTDGPGALGPGELVWFPAGTDHYYDATVPSSMVWFHLAPGHRRWRHLTDQPFRCWPAQTRDLPGLFEHLHEEMKRPAATDHRICRAGCELILACVERELAVQEPPTRTRHRQRLASLWREVATDLTRSWTVEDLAQHAAMSVPHFHAVVLELFDTTPMGMVARLRMDQARVLLRHTQLTLDAIAGQVGYATSFAFSRAFKRYEGMAPSTYRKVISV